MKTRPNVNNGRAEQSTERRHRPTQPREGRGTASRQQPYREAPQSAPAVTDSLAAIRSPSQLETHIAAPHDRNTVREPMVLVFTDYVV